MPLGVPAAWHRAAILGNGEPIQGWAQDQLHRPGHTQGHLSDQALPGSVLTCKPWAALILACFSPI